MTPPIMPDGSYEPYRGSLPLSDGSWGPAGPPPWLHQPEDEYQYSTFPALLTVPDTDIPIPPDPVDWDDLNGKWAA